MPMETCRHEKDVLARGTQRAPNREPSDEEPMFTVGEHATLKVTDEVIVRTSMESVVVKFESEVTKLLSPFLC